MIIEEQVSFKESPWNWELLSKLRDARRNQNTDYTLDEVLEAYIHKPVSKDMLPLNYEV